MRKLNELYDVKKESEDERKIKAAAKTPLDVLWNTAVRKVGGMKNTEDNFYKIGQQFMNDAKKAGYKEKEVRDYLAKQYKAVSKYFEKEFLSPLDRLYESVCKEGKISNNEIKKILDEVLYDEDKFAHQGVIRIVKATPTEIVFYRKFDRQTVKNTILFRNGKIRVDWNMSQEPETQKNKTKLINLFNKLTESLSKESVCKEELKVDSKHILKLKQNNIDFTKVGNELLVDESDAQRLNGLGIPYSENIVGKETTPYEDLYNIDDEKLNAHWNSLSVRQKGVAYKYACAGDYDMILETRYNKPWEELPTEDREKLKVYYQKHGIRLGMESFTRINRLFEKVDR